MTRANPDRDLTAALRAFADGGRASAEDLLRLVYARLHAIAQEHMRREGAGHTLQPTALVSEAYLRLLDQRTEWRSRSHFFAVASQAMRRVLVDHARARDSKKRGGGRRAVALPDAIAPETSPDSGVDILALDEALAALARLDEESVRVVEMRFFAGMELDAIAAHLGVSERTVRRHWVYAKAWLGRALGSAERGATRDGASEP